MEITVIRSEVCRSRTAPYLHAIVVDFRRREAWRNEDEIAIIQAIAASDNDGPVLMLNLNRYKPDAGFSGTGLHQEYMTVLEAFLPVVGGKIL